MFRGSENWIVLSAESMNGIMQKALATQFAHSPCAEKQIVTDVVMRKEKNERTFWVRIQPKESADEE